MVKLLAQFYDELSMFEMLVVYMNTVIVRGDFNVRFQEANYSDTCRLGDLLTSLDMLQHIQGRVRLTDAATR